ncbi:MAG: phage recombination protein Bet [Ruminococcus sp.]|nr:phage recombination protein Bet [Ruminococcus sp.]
MAVANTIAEVPKKSLIINYRSGEEDVKLSPQIVKNYLVSGNADKVTDQEIMMFMMLCKHQHLNPFLREAYLIKYGTSPATIVTGKAAFEKRANRCENYEGFEAGVIVLHSNGELDYRAGTLVLTGEQLVGGWADVYVKNYRKPIRAEVSLNEYIGRKSDGTVNSQWAAKPATMIRKVAKMQALCEAFPEDLQGLYAAEEVTPDQIPDEQHLPPINQAIDIINEPEQEPKENIPLPPDDDFSAIMEG